MPCPNLNEFEQLIDGRLVFDAAERIADHVEHCDRCVELLERLESRDTLVAAIRTAATIVIDDDDDSETQQCIVRMLALAPASETPPPDSPEVAPPHVDQSAVTPAELAVLRWTPKTGQGFKI